RSLKVVVSRKADILNLSLGRMVPWSNAEEHLRKCKLCRFTNRLAAEHDILVVAAVGNWADQANGCPALCRNVVSIGCALPDEQISFFRDHPEQEIREFIDGRSSTSFAAAMASAQFAALRSAFPAISA